MPSSSRKLAARYGFAHDLPVFEPAFASAATWRPPRVASRNGNSRYNIARVAGAARFGELSTAAGRFAVSMRVHVNSFFWIGILLIGIAIYSLVKGPSFQFDAGVPNEPYEAPIYLVVGIMMIVNGVFHPTVPADDKSKISGSVSPAKPAGSGSVAQATTSSRDDAQSNKISNV
jgi:hypothetical protein